MAAIAPQPRMLNETPAQLVAHLDASERLVARHRAAAARAQAGQVGRAGAAADGPRRRPNLFGRFHALWTLEGLGALDAALVREQMKDREPADARSRRSAPARRSTRPATDPAPRDYRDAAKDPDADVVIQAMLTLNVLKVPDAAATIQAAQAANKARGVQEIGRQILNPPPLTGAADAAARRPASRRRAAGVMQRGEAIYKELCFSCHGDDGRGAPRRARRRARSMAPSLVGIAARDRDIATTSSRRCCTA